MYIIVLQMPSLAWYLDILEILVLGTVLNARVSFCQLAAPVNDPEPVRRSYAGDLTCSAPTQGGGPPGERGPAPKTRGPPPDCRAFQTAAAQPLGQPARAYSYDCPPFLSTLTHGKYARSQKASDLDLDSLSRPLHNTLRSTCP